MVWGCGAGETVIITLSLLEHPVAVTISVKMYVVVDKGDTVGLEELDINPSGLETHE